MKLLSDIAAIGCCGAVVYGLAQWNAGLAWVGGGLIGVTLLIVVEKEIVRRRKP